MPSGLNATPLHRLGVAGQRRADLVAAGGIPDPQRRSPLPETMRGPSGLNATLVTAAGVAGQRRADLLAAVGIPHPQRPIPAAGDDARAVGAERHTVHRMVWPVSGAPTAVPGPTPAASSPLPETMRCRRGYTPRCSPPRCGRSAARRPGRRCRCPTPAASDRRCRRRCGSRRGYTPRCSPSRCGRSAARRPARRCRHPTPAPCRRPAGDDPRAVGAKRHTLHRCVGVAGFTGPTDTADRVRRRASHTRSVSSQPAEAMRRRLG